MYPKTQGERSEGMILARLLELGYSVSLPFGNNQRYDMVLDIEGKLFRAQCKTGRLVDGKVIFPVASKHWKTSVRHLYTGQIDFFLVYCPQTKGVYKIPIELTGKSNFSLRVDKSTRPGPKKFRWAKDFTV